MEQDDPKITGGEGYPKHHEMWGDALDTARFLQKALVASLLLNALMIVVVNHALRKPPIVIRVDQLGVATPIGAFSSESRVTKPEVVNFTKLYLEYFLERSFYTWKENQLKAGAMMTSSFRERANHQTNFSEETTAVVSGKLSSKLQISDVTVSHETSDHIVLTVKGIRETSSFTDPLFNKQTIFEVEMSLKKTPRTLETPYGLLVDDYRQTILK